MIRFLTALAFLAASTGIVMAVTCGLDHTRLVIALETGHNEGRKVIGTVGSKSIMEIFVAQDGDWTFVVTSVDGRSCIIATGHDWEEVPPGKGT